MNIKSTWYYIVVILIAAALVLLSRELTSPGQRKDTQDALLPDHITRVVGTTLPLAILQSRQQGKGGVRVTDPNGNSVWVSTNSVTETEFIVRGVPQNGTQNLEEGIESIEQEVPQFTKRQSLDVEDDTRVRFVINVTNHAEVAAVLYEISVRVFMIQSTSHWTIDLTDDPYNPNIQLGAPAGESTVESTVD